MHVDVQLIWEFYKQMPGGVGFFPSGNCLPVTLKVTSECHHVSRVTRHLITGLGVEKYIIIRQFIIV